MATRVVWFSVALFLVSGCGNGGGVLPLDYYCDAVAVPCAEIAACCEDRGHAADASLCEAAVAQECQERLDAAAAAGATYDSEAGAVCMDAFRRWVAQCDDAAPPPDRCDEVFIGAGAPGGIPGDPVEAGGLDAMCNTLFATQ